jgi:O-antigen biosynthesis protein
MEMNPINPREQNYYSIIRKDIISLIPKSVKKILDVGCGYGSTAAVIKEKYPDIEIIGIELSEEAAIKSQKNVDRVINGDIEIIEPDFPVKYFDLIICADVLEHTKDPWSVLKKLHKYQNDDAILIASIPNIRYIKVLLKILFNKFEYEASGVLDVSHLRFFTLHTIKKMFKECGFQIIKIKNNRNKGWKMRLLSILSFGILFPFGIYQYIIVAKKSS